LTNWDRAHHPIRRHLTNYAGPRVKCSGFGRVLASLMDFHVSDDLPRNRRQMSLGLCRHKFVAVHLGFVGFSSHCCNHHRHHFGYHVGAFVGGLLIEIGDATVVAEIEIHLDAYDVGAVVGLGVGGAAVGVDAAAGVDVAAVGAAVDAAVDVGETVVVAAFGADVASERASSFAVASYAVVGVVVGVVVVAAVVVAAVVVAVAFDVELAVNALFVVVDLVAPSSDVQVLQLS